MSYDDTVVMGRGNTAMQHVAITLPRATDRPAPVPPTCRTPRGKRRRDVAYYVDGGILVGVQCGPMIGAIDARLRLWRRTITGFLG